MRVLFHCWLSIKEQQSTIENLKDRINKLEGVIMFYKVVLKSVV